MGHERQNIDSFDLAGAQLHELAQVMSALPEWQSVKAAMADAWARTANSDKTIAAGRTALAQAHMGGEAILAHVPEHYSALISTEDRRKLSNALDELMLYRAAYEIETGAPLPLPSMAGGDVRVEVVEEGDVRMAVVHAYATPLGDPEDIAARFLVACYRTFDTETFANREKGLRDAEWWRRWRNDETFREIALSDSRSGLAPEARVDKKTYRSEITRATDRVRRAVKRFHKRWTQKLDSMSKNEG